MAYTINLTDGTVFATISDGTINTSSSMILVGKNYAGYGEFLDENFIHLLENGSNTTAPAAPLTGQLWWDKTNTLLKVYNGSIFKTISAATASATQPSSNVTGDLWYDTTNQQLKVYTGTVFLVVGPGYTSAQGTSGAIPETILDSVGATKYITSLYVNSVRVGIVYNGTSFVPEAALLAAFPTIYPGITLSSSVSGAVFAGNATNAELLDSLDSTAFMRADANTATSGRLQVNNANGIYIGTSNVVNISQSSNDGLITAPVSTGNLIIRTNVSGTTYTVATALGASGTFAIANAATVGTTLSAVGNVTGGNLRTGGQVSATGNVIGANFIGNVIPPAGGAVSTSGNITGGNFITSGLINTSSTSNTSISTAGNIQGSYFYGNGSTLSGLSAAVSVTNINNGTSEIKIGASGGNANVSIGGTGNVLVLTSSTAYFSSDISATGILNANAGNGVGNIGGSGSYFNRVFATATTALYADVAERFAADELLEPGTVVELGGAKEITRSQQDLSENVFGVISTNAAYLMNGGAGEDDTHPPVAMTGRVPVKAVGIVRRGDRLVSAGSGVARAAQPGEATAFNVIGRSLEDKHLEELGTIEAIVTIK
tara:strand:+ start:5346 stop:7151 length:1806 start_codon:yes stop_codon:yes gene_type:complete